MPGVTGGRVPGGWLGRLSYRAPPGGRLPMAGTLAFGFHNPAALNGLALLALGGLRPALPGAKDQEFTHGTGRRASFDRRGGRDSLAFSLADWPSMTRQAGVTLVLVEQAGASRSLG